MSIAVSAVVKPSRLLHAMVWGMCLCVVFSGAMLGASQAGYLAPWVRIFIGCACALIAAVHFFQFTYRRKAYSVDISGLGQIRLTEIRKPSKILQENDSTVVCLGRGSTLWPNMLLLRLKSESQRVTVVPIFRDSVSAGDFRKISVACRWIALHKTSTLDWRF
jgi:hypothetical protein